MRFLAARPVLTHGHAACFCAGALPRAKAVPVLTHGHAACFRAGALPQARAVPMLIHGHATCFCAGALPRAKAVPALAHGYAPVSVLVRKAGAAQICGRAPVRAFSPHPAQKRKYHCCTKGKAPASGKNGRWLRSRPRWAAAHLRPAALPSSHFGSLAGHRVFRVYQCRLARQTKHPGWRPSTRTTWPGGIQAAKNRLALCTAMVVNPCAVW